MTCPSCGSHRVKRHWWWTSAYRCLDCGREWEVTTTEPEAERFRYAPPPWRWPGLALILALLATPATAQIFPPDFTLPAASTEVEKEEPPPSPGVGMGFLCTVPSGDNDPQSGCEPAVALPVYSRPAGEGRRWSLMAAVTEARAGLGVGYCSGSACVAVGVVAPWSTEAGWEVEEWRFAGGVSVGLRDLVGWVGR